MKKSLVVYPQGDWFVVKSKELNEHSKAIAVLELEDVQEEVDGNKVKTFVRKHQAIFLAVGAFCSGLVGWATGKYDLLAFLSQVFSVFN